jgi:dTDP-4-amino-4,6-dideoxygalactose transaminase
VIPFVDFRAQYRSIKPEIDAAIARVLESGQFILGEEVAAFEREFAEYCGVEHGVALNSGTSALHLALLAADVGAGDEVITVPFTFVATAATIVYAGAVPVFVDVDERSLTMSPEAIAAAITPRTKAIVPVHLYGQPADMDAIRAVAADHGLVVIEDAAQAHGARYRGIRVGGLGDLACFSFYPTKNLGAYGEGGIVVTNDPAYADRVRLLRDWGQARKYEHTIHAFNMRMEALQGAILRVKLRHLPQWTTARRRIAAEYGRLLDGCGAMLPIEMDYATHVYHQYALRVADRAAFQESLREAGVPTALHYPVPVHLQPAYAYLGYAEGSFPVAERAARETVSLPMYPELTDEHVQHVVTSVRRALAPVST